MRKIRRSQGLSKDADLDITAFMNLMIVLVPVLLLGMVFSQITVLDLKLPDLASSDSDNKNDKKQIELIIRDTGMIVNYPAGILLKRLPKIEVLPDLDSESTESDPSQGVQDRYQYDFKLLSLVLQEMKRQLREKDIENRSITILSSPDTSYQTIISTMDTVRSFKAVVAVSVVDAELFPEVSFGDAPVVDVESGGIEK
ncbi:MAG: biopolymer transporter ExbD [Spongiibacteraceae bacterium]|nr:biopolymer transporter ExbD [Spongiibacteraceae bacterium]